MFGRNKRDLEEELARVRWVAAADRAYVQELNNRLMRVISDNVSLNNRITEHAIEEARIRAYLDYQRSMSYHPAFEHRDKTLEQIVSNFSTTILGDRVLMEMEQQRNFRTVEELRKRIGELETLLVMANEKKSEASLSDKR